jgi:hypothetical protein
MNRNALSPIARATARQLFAYEAGAGESSGGNVAAAIRVFEKLRRPLSTLVGATGFRMLLGRALTLAKAQDPNLGAVRVQPDGSLEGLSELRPNENGQAGVALIAQLLSLLESFIGPELALRLVADEWPDLPAFEREAGGESEK